MDRGAMALCLPLPKMHFHELKTPLGPFFSRTASKRDTNANRTAPPKLLSERLLDLEVLFRLIFSEADNQQFWEGVSTSCMADSLAMTAFASLRYLQPKISGTRTTSPACRVAREQSGMVVERTAMINNQHKHCPLPKPLKLHSRREENKLPVCNCGCCDSRSGLPFGRSAPTPLEQSTMGASL